MNKAIKIKVDLDGQKKVELEKGSNWLTSEDGEFYINPAQISSFVFDPNEISIYINSDDRCCLKFNAGGEGEYQRIRREIKEFFGVE